MEDNGKKKKSREIDVIDIVKKILAEKKLLSGFMLVFAVLGVIYALNTQKTYTSNVLLAPEITNSGGMAKSIGELASMVGVDLSTAAGSSVDAIYPEIYPEVVASSDFIVKLFSVKVPHTDISSADNYFDHLVYDPKIPFWSYPLIWIKELFLSSEDDKGNKSELNPFQLSKSQDNVCGVIRSNITCLVDKKTSVINITVKDIDPLIAAIIADTVKNRLKEHIILYRTKKARNDLEYAEKLFEEARANYVKARQTYASYADANEGLVLQSFISKRDELENDMQLKFNMYNQVAQQLQLAKSRVQEKTPVFTTIQSSTVPVKASSTPRAVMVLIFILIGILADALWILYLREPVKRYLKKK